MTKEFLFVATSTIKHAQQCNELFISDSFIFCGHTYMINPLYNYVLTSELTLGRDIYSGHYFRQDIYQSILQI